MFLYSIRCRFDSTSWGKASRNLVEPQLFSLNSFHPLSFITLLLFLSSSFVVFLFGFPRSYREDSATEVGGRRHGSRRSWAALRQGVTAPVTCLQRHDSSGSRHVLREVHHVIVVVAVGRSSKGCRSGYVSLSGNRSRCRTDGLSLR